MPSLRALAHVAALAGLASVGLTLGAYLRDPHVGGAAFVLVVAIAVGALLWRLYRPGGVARRAVDTSPRGGGERGPTMEAGAAAAPAPAPVARADESPPAPRRTPQSGSGTEPTRLYRRKLLPPGVAVATLTAGVVALLVSSGSDGPRSRPVPRAAAPTTPARAQPRGRPRPPAAPAKRTEKPRSSRRPAPARRRAISARGLSAVTLRPGSKGGDVRLLQRTLRLPATGRYDARTTAAVRAFQRKHGLPTSGVVATLTHKALRKTFP